MHQIYAKPAKKIALAYSGGLDTSVMLHWLKATHNAEILAYCANVGQGAELENLEQKALQTGASKLHVVDLQEEFVRDFVFPAVQLHAVYEGHYLLGTALARPLIAKKQVEIALLEGADAVAHGATGKGNDQVRFEFAYAALAPKLDIIAPWREWSFSSRIELIDYAKKHNIPVTATLEKPYSTDSNLAHTSYEGGILEDPWAEPPEDIFKMTQSIDKAPQQASYIEISFEAGVPVALDGVLLSPKVLLQKLNALAGSHGIGRVDIVENRFVGIKSRGVYESPGVHALHVAHNAIESITLEAGVVHFRNALSHEAAELIYNGMWFAPKFQAILAMLKQMQKPVNGCVRLKLHHGSCIAVGRKSPNSIYARGLASFDGNHGFSPADASGFIKMHQLQMKGAPSP
jgi:argininosuccinate synthase